MKRYPFLTVLGFSIIAITLGTFIRGYYMSTNENTGPAKLPWKIEQTTSGNIKVFDITLGVTTIDEAVNHLETGTEISMYISKEGVQRVEAYFNNVELHGLGAKVVATADLTTAERKAMYERGVRINQQDSGIRKVELDPADIARTYQATVTSLTYIPFINLKDELVLKRFGEPTQRIKQRNSDVVHWLYPELGLSIAMSPSEKEVLQYISPARFSELSGPLLAQEAE